jgi:tetratricopeptide (TPR) repeat protein
MRHASGIYYSPASILAAILTAVVLMSAAGATMAQAPQFSREVGKPLSAAQRDIKDRKWDSAMLKIREAEAVKKKSAHEQYSINELKAFVLMNQRNYVEAARVYEQNLRSGAMPAAEIDNRLKTLTTLHMRLRNNPKVIEYCKRWVAAGGANDPQAHQILAQAYYQQNDYRNAISAIDKAVLTAQRRGRKVEENWLVLKLNSYYALKDDKGVLRTRKQLVRAYPSREHWEPLLDTLSRNAGDDRAKLYFYRLMLDLGVLKNPADYVEMAQMMMDQEFGVPGEAVQVIQKGFANKVLDNKDRDRHLRVQDSVKARAEAARKQVAQLEEQARKGGSGETDVRLGAQYLSFGEHQKAVAVLQRGLRRGGVKDINDARMLLGLAHYRAGQKHEAGKVFRSVSNDSTLATIADLWALRTQQSS